MPMIVIFSDYTKICSHYFVFHIKINFVFYVQWEILFAVVSQNFVRALSEYLQIMVYRWWNISWLCIQMNCTFYLTISFGLISSSARSTASGLRSLLWIFSMCFFSECGRLALKSQCGHLCGRSPVCRNMCRFTLSERLLVKSQWGHLWILPTLSFLWAMTILCVLQVQLQCLPEHGLGGGSGGAGSPDGFSCFIHLQSP